VAFLLRVGTRARLAGRNAAASIALVLIKASSNSSAGGESAKRRRHTGCLFTFSNFKDKSESFMHAPSLSLRDKGSRF
jgi:hypothetical protein